MLIDTRDPDPDPGPRPRRRDIDWRLWFWSFESVGLFVAASSLAGFVAVGLAFGGLFAGLKALETFCGGPGTGLTTTASSGAYNRRSRTGGRVAEGAPLLREYAA